MPKKLANPVLPPSPGFSGLRPVSHFPSGQSVTPPEGGRTGVKKWYAPQKRVTLLIFFFLFHWFKPVSSKLSQSLGSPWPKTSRQTLESLSTNQRFPFVLCRTPLISFSTVLRRSPQSGQNSPHFTSRLWGGK